MKKKFSQLVDLDLDKFVSFASMPITVTDVRDNFRFIIANKAYESFANRRVLGLRLFDAFSPEEVKINQEIFDTYTSVAKTKSPTVIEGQPLKLYDKKTKWTKTLYFSTYIFPVLDTENQTKYLVTIIMDVTKTFEGVENLRVEKELRDTFLTGLGHDLTQPLVTAKMSALKLQEILPVDSEINKLTKATVHGLERIETLFKSLLDAYYLNATKEASLKISEFSPHDVTKALLEVMAFTNGDRFTFKSKGRFKVCWDREGYMRILENYLSNAIKYSKVGTTITVTLEHEMNKVRLCVHNVGNPIPADEQGRLFKMFHKGSTGKGLKGWGLGLAIVKGIAEAHGGISGVSSHAKKGTTFYVELPKKVKLS